MAVANSAFPQSINAVWWQDKSNVRNYAQWLADRLQIKQLGDWYHVEKTTIIQAGGVSYAIQRTTYPFTNIQH